MRGSNQHGRRWEPWKTSVLNVQGEEQLVYHNNRYHVFYRKHTVEGVPHAIIHLSIKNNDRSARHDWRDFQRIKNEIVGPHREMVELYPREANKVDLSNQYHLWGYDTDEPVFSGAGGLGWQSAKLVWNGTGPRPNIPGTEDAVQRPSDEESTTAIFDSEKEQQ
jgi:hypothetical protein